MFFKPINVTVFFLRLVIASGMLLCTNNGYAQTEKRFLLYDAADGLSNNNIHSITRTTDGLVWIGTQDGLCSFDGNQFQVYKHIESDSNSISDQFVLSIKEDARNNLWVGTRSGLNYFNRKTRRFRRYYLDESERHVFQSSYDHFFVQKDGKLLLHNKGLQLLDPVSGKFIQIQPDNKQQIAWLVQPDYSGWSFNSDNKVYHYTDVRRKNNKVVGTHQLLLPAGYNISFRQLLSDDSLIVLHNLLQLDTIYCFNKFSQSIDKKIAVPRSSFDVCRAGNDFLLCNAEGIFSRNIYSGMQWEPLRANTSNGLPSSGFTAAYTDESGNIWLGSSGAGLAVNNRNLGLFTTIPTMIPNERINAVWVSGNTLYAGTYSGLYRIVNLSSKNPLAFDRLLAGKFISAVTTDHQQNIWAAVRNEGILVLAPSGKILRTITLPDPATTKTVFNLTTNKKGRILISTSQGFFYTDPAKENTIHSIDSSGIVKPLTRYYMNSFTDENGLTWAAGYHGIDIMSETMRPLRSLKSFRDDESFLQRTIITSVTQDKQGVFWIATIRNGVYRYTGNNFTHYTHADGLPSDITYNIICDSLNRIWVCSSAGLSVFDPIEKTFRSIPAFDGVSKIAFSLGPVTSYGNKLIFGANGKLLIADAANYEIRKQELSAYVSDVKINGQSIDITNRQLQLMPDNKLIQFEFASSPAFHSGNIIYQYRMKGIDSNWITLSSGTSSISYTGLPYKKLVMELRAAGAMNALNKAPVFSLTIQASPPFYKTSWFMITGAIVLIGAGFGLLALYNRRRYRRQLQALQVEKELHKERSRIGRDLHDNIGAYTSALIAGLGRIKPADDSQQTEIINLKEYGSSIMGLLRETIWMLNAEALTVTGFADRFINYAMRINKNYPGIDIVFEENISNDKKLQPRIMLNLFRILQEALHNACKHSEAAKIIVHIQSNDQLIFSITDDGKGFDGNSVADHYGIGNMRARAAEAGFTMTIDTKEGKGTKISLLQNTANA